MSLLRPGWAKACLSDFCDVIQGQSPPSSTYNCEGRGLPFFQGKADFGSINPIARVWCDQPNKIAEIGDVLISIRAPVGPTNIANQTCAIGRGLAAVRPLGQIPTAFVLYAIRFREHELQRVATGSTFAAISGNQLRDLAIPLPPLPEQHRIVAEIEKQFTRSDAAKEAIERGTRRIKRLTSTLFEEAFSEFRVDMRTLGDIAEVQGGIQKQPKRRPMANSYPFLRVANVLRGKLDLSEVHRIELFGDELEKLRLQMGDLLIVEGNGSPKEIGRMAIWDGSIQDCVHQNHIIRARLRARILPEFVAAFWNSPSGTRAVRSVASSTSGLHTLSVSKVKAIPCPVPCIERQVAVIARLQEMVSTADVTTSSLRACEARSNRLRRAILAKAFSGQLVPQDPNDEPASVLLERIRAARGSSKPKLAARRRATAHLELTARS